MKSKKGDVELLPVIIITVLIIVAGFLIYFRTLKPVAEGESNINTVQSWMLTVTGKQKVTLGTSATGRPPVPYLDTPYVVDNLDQLNKESQEEIANSIYDCARAFDFGEINFMTKLEQDIFCFECRAVIFSDDLKSQDQKLRGVKEYMDTTKPTSGTGTYTQILKDKATKNNFYVITESYSDGTMPIKNDLYIYFAASNKKLSLGEAAAFGAGVGLAATPVTIWIGGPLGVAAGVVGGTLGGLIGNLIADPKYKTMVVVAEPSVINKMCNAQSLNQNEVQPQNE